MPAGFDFGRALVDKLDEWVDGLAAPLMPPRQFVEGSEVVRLEFREHRPHAVMIGKCIRAVSGIHAALVLADLGYVTECASLLRIVSDFCIEINAIGEALNSGGELPRAVGSFVNAYFVPLPRTPEAFAAAERGNYVSREELMKAEVRQANNAKLDRVQLLTTHRFLNKTYDAYVHGAYETAMDLFDSDTGRFMLHGHPSRYKRQEFVEAVLLKLHEVVVALEVTAAATASSAIFEAARNARRTMDASEPWRIG